MQSEKMSSTELQAFESKWRRIFSVFGAMLVVILIDLVAFHPGGTHKAMILLLGFPCVLVCMYSGKKLRDLERVDAAIDAEELMSWESHDGD